jgi:hypothetical protein
MVIEILSLIAGAGLQVYHDANAGIYTRPALETPSRCEQIKRHEITATNPKECETEKNDDPNPLPEH